MNNDDNFPSLIIGYIGKTYIPCSCMISNSEFPRLAILNSTLTPEMQTMSSDLYNTTCIENVAGAPKYNMTYNVGSYISTQMIILRNIFIHLSKIKQK